jgi:hypothetical protein
MIGIFLCSVFQPFLDFTHLVGRKSPIFRLTGKPQPGVPQLGLQHELAIKLAEENNPVTRCAAGWRSWVMLR